MSSPTGGRPMEILLVEDNLTDARLTIEALKAGGVKHRLTLVWDGTEALEFLYQEGRFARAPRPDLILLDLTLPKTDGREVLTQIKSDYELKEIPVVILTASRTHEDILRTQLLHAEAYITKPLDLDKFLAVVRQLREIWAEDVILPVTG